VITMGLRELMLLALVVVVLYGRSGVLKSRQFQTIWPWISPQRRMTRVVGSLRAASASRPQSTATQAERPRLSARKGKHFLLQGNRLYWFLTILAATAVATVIVARMIIASGAGPGLTR
jgi:hypothetical protein